MNTTDQLLEMLKTIDEAEAFLRKRCSAGQTGQSMALFEDLASLLELLDIRYRKSGYLPKDPAPVFGPSPDILSAVRFLDAVDRWSGQVRDRVKRRKVRQELARGGILEAATKEGNPFAKKAVEIAQLARNGTPEERAGQDRGVSVSFSSEGVEKARSGAIPMVTASQQTGRVSPAEERPEPESGGPSSLDDPAAEGARLLAGMRARTGRTTARSRAADKTATDTDLGEMEGGPRPMEARSRRPERQAAPIETKDSEDGPRPMSARPRKPEGEARPMGSPDTEDGPRPMGARSRKAVGEARPMGSSDTEDGPRPMGSRPKETENGARPMGQRTRGAGNRPERPAPPETTTTPAVGRGIAIDREFLRICNELGKVSEEELEKRLVDAFPKLENRYKMVICDQIRRLGYWGRMEPERNEFEALRRRAQELARHRDEYSWLYGKLGDYRSRKTLLAILDNWYSFNLKDLSNMKDKLYAPYLDADLLRCADNEVFVDLGAGTGEVTSAFGEFAGHWKKIYCYEPHPGNFAALHGKARDMGLVDAREKAVGDREGEVNLQYKDDPLLARIGEQGTKVEMVTLDNDVTEPVSIIKMCLEGGEQAAIRGCSNHIHGDHPRLVLRADHGDSDLWQLPRMIERLDKKYRFYLRHYGGNLVPSEYVLYAI